MSKGMSSLIAAWGGQHQLILAAAYVPSANQVVLHTKIGTSCRKLNTVKISVLDDVRYDRNPVARKAQQLFRRSCLGPRGLPSNHLAERKRDFAPHTVANQDEKMKMQLRQTTQENASDL